MAILWAMIDVQTETAPEIQQQDSCAGDLWFCAMLFAGSFIILGTLGVLIFFALF